MEANTERALREQKEYLVSEILDTFSCPDKWPMTDEERRGILRKLYHIAQTIRRTEISGLSPSMEELRKIAKMY